MKSKIKITNVMELNEGDYIAINGKLHKLIQNSSGTFSYYLYKDILDVNTLEKSTFDPGPDWRELMGWKWNRFNSRFSDQEFYRIS